MANTSPFAYSLNNLKEVQEDIDAAGGFREYCEQGNAQFAEDFKENPLGATADLAAEVAKSNPYLVASMPWFYA